MMADFSAAMRRSSIAAPMPGHCGGDPATAAVTAALAAMLPPAAKPPANIEDDDCDGTEDEEEDVCSREVDMAEFVAEAAREWDW